ncbi:MAG: dephospho-CoA kinase [Chitinivibrionales bacterium]|nr:dephospho-CoA kinase [Chitinivibrionales bacterium]
MRTIGVAGFMGSGKTFVARYCAGTRGEIIDADLAAKQVMNGDDALKRELAGAFGPLVVSQGALNFTELGAAAFADSSRLKTLNAIVHPRVVAYLYQCVKSVAADLCILDAALIPVWDIESWFDALLWIEASPAVRLDRLKKKSALDEAALLRRMRLQEELLAPPRGTKWRTVVNEHDAAALYSALDDFMKTVSL